MSSLGASADPVVGDTPADRPPADLIRSLRRGLAVLDYVAGARAPVTPKQVGAALGLNLSTAYHLINTLLYDGYLLRESSGGTTALRATAGRPRATATGPATPESVAVRRVLGRGAYAAEDSTVMALPQLGSALIIVSEAVPGGESAGHYEAGSTHPLHSSAVGRVMMATAPASDTAALLEQAERLADRHGERYQRRQVDRAIEQVRARGSCFAMGERDACVGVPVFDAVERPVGALAVVVSPRRLRESPEAFVRIAERTSQAVTRELGKWGIDARSAFGSLAA